MLLPFEVDWGGTGLSLAVFLTVFSFKHMRGSPKHRKALERRERC